MGLPNPTGARRSAECGCGSGVVGCAMRMLNLAFDDKRWTSVCIGVWLLICVVGFGWLGIFESEYMRFGPSSTLTYMGLHIDTAPRYAFVVVFVVVSTAVNDFSSDALSPWLQNTVLDHKSKVLPYRKSTVLGIAQFWSFYCGSSQTTHRLPY